MAYQVWDRPQATILAPAHSLAEPEIVAPTRIQLTTLPADATAEAEVSSPRSSFDCDLSDFQTDVDYSDPENWSKFRNDFNRRLAELSNRSSVSTNSEHLLVSGLISPGNWRNGELDKIRTATSNRPSDAHFQWHLLHVCGEQISSGECDSEYIESIAIQQANQDSLVWIAIAANRSKRGDDVAAIDALRNAIGAPEFRNSFIEDVLMVERAFSAGSDEGMNERVFGAIGFAATFPSVGVDVYEICKERVSDSAQWQDACLQMAARIESASMSLLDMSIAAALQRIIFEQTGAAAELAEVTSRERQLSEITQRMATQAEQIVIATDESAMTRFLEEWAAHGEPAAQKLLQEETVRLLSVDGYNPCDKIPIQAQ